MIFCEMMTCYHDGVRKHDQPRLDVESRRVSQGKGEPRFTKSFSKRLAGEFHIPLPGSATKIWITLSLFISGQNDALIGWTPALPSRQEEKHSIRKGSKSNLWVWKLAHSRSNRDVSKRQTNNLLHRFMREIVLNALGEKLLTELNVDSSLHHDRF